MDSPQAQVIPALSVAKGACPFGLALHGGALISREHDYGAEKAHMQDLATRYGQALIDGAHALDVVEGLIVELELSGLYVAGRGACPNLGGAYELDASLMVGQGRKAGAVAGLQGYKSPITAARKVMEETPHVLFAGEGAARFAAEQGLEAIEDAESWFTKVGLNSETHVPGVLGLGTVGCVALDQHGVLVAGTSTAGVFGKRFGRVGDSPIIGAGTWADDHVAVSCTGLGEYFLRTTTAAQISYRLQAGQDFKSAANGAIDDMASLGGQGGLIAITKTGEILTPFRATGMKRATVNARGEISVKVFEG